MESPNQTPIKTRPDGSIDTQFYVARGRQARADAARAMVTRSGPARHRGRHAILPVGAVMVAIMVLLPVMI